MTKAAVLQEQLNDFINNMEQDEIDGYICTADPLVHSWNNAPWIEGKVCIKANAGLVYKNKGGIYRCNENGNKEDVKTLSKALRERELQLRELERG